MKRYQNLKIVVKNLMKLNLFLVFSLCVFNTCYANYAEVSITNKQMIIFNNNGDVLNTYTIRTGLNYGCKTKEGDKKTPCGEYKIVEKRDSKYVKFLALNYPNKQDRAKGYTGSAVGIHYYNSEYTNDPSTLEGSLGCLTVWNKNEILEINKLLKVGDSVKITLE